MKTYKSTARAIKRGHLVVKYDDNGNPQLWRRTNNGRLVRYAQGVPYNDI